MVGMQRKVDAAVQRGRVGGNMAGKILGGAASAGKGNAVARDVLGGIARKQSPRAKGRR